MTEFNAIYDSNKRQVGKFRLGVAWSIEPRVRLGGYDYGDEGVICDSTSKQVAYFKDCSVAATDGTTIGHFIEVPFSEFTGEESMRSKTLTIKRLETGGQILGWV